jgi:hypothetical protein
VLGSGLGLAIRIIRVNHVRVRVNVIVSNCEDVKLMLKIYHHGLLRLPMIISPFFK